MVVYMLHSETIILDKITNPQDVKQFNLSELKTLCNEIRSFLISSISKTGGHIGANLGVVELTLALHYVLDLNRDSLLFDVGHQGYTHKLLTGRKSIFSTLNTYKGMSRFICRSESTYDLIDASHAGTAISIATGYALRNMCNKNGDVAVALIGDGSLSEGMAWEALNYAPQKNLPMMIVINDNGMSIPVNVGGLNKMFQNREWKKLSGDFFRALGYEYFPVENGNDIENCINVIREAYKNASFMPVVVHAKTIKGYGLPLADKHPYRMHFSFPFDPNASVPGSPTGADRAYTAVVAEVLNDILSKQPQLKVLTPATPYASGVEKLLELYPENVIDVGMSEQHCLGMAAGIALASGHTIACFQSTFMQRAFDQLFHDICYMNLPVTILSSRSGFSGFDSPTHHAVYDLTYLNALPGLSVYYAGTEDDLRKIIEYRCVHPIGPMVILHPYEPLSVVQNVIFESDAIDVFSPRIIKKGTDALILAVGNRIASANMAVNKLKEMGMEVALYQVRQIYPFQEEILASLIQPYNLVVVAEENIFDGGFACMVGALIAQKFPGKKLIRHSLEKVFIPAGDKDKLSALCEITEDELVRKIRENYEQK
jgi:1-deoxy-D-xylulose-5-phosphate synthase